MPAVLVAAPVSFTEEWFSQASQEALAGLARSVAHLHGAIVEVGCWEGRSTCALARACYPAIVHAVDTWEGSPGEISAQLAGERDVFATFLANVAVLTAGNVDPHRMGWREFFDGWVEPLRLVHIDATHTYDEVRDNLEAVLPHVVPGGVVCGDDVHHPPVARAVVDVLGPNVTVEASLWVWRRGG